MSIYTGRATVPEPTASPGTKAIMAAVESYGDVELAVAAIQSAQTRINRGLHDHFHHPVMKPGDRTVDVLLDMTNGLVKALRETRDRLEQGLAKLHESRGAP